MAECVPVRFEPGGLTIWVERGTPLVEAARKAGSSVDTPCAGRGVCGGCGVRVLEGALAPPDEMELVGLRRAPAGVRLACRAIVVDPVCVRPVVAYPTRSVRDSGARPSPRGVPKALVAAVDLGTSSVAAVILERESRIEVGRGSAPNHQSAWGADVVSRIAAAVAGEADALREAAERSVLDALVAACADEGLCVASIERLVVAGNSAMSGLLLGADVSGLAAHPFTEPYAGSAALREHSSIVAELPKDAETVVLPPLAGFVGGDVLAGLVAEDLLEAEGMLIDLGTNAEVVLAVEEGLVVTSAAAGPAFEAVGLSSGGPAVPGAIERVELGSDGRLEFSVIGETEPRWMCGSGLVSAVALLRRLGHIDADGLLWNDGPLLEHFFERDGVRTVRLPGIVRRGTGATSSESSGAEVANDSSRDSIVITQLDVRAFQLAKAAVHSAIDAVARAVSGSDGEKDVIIAGAFGSALEVGDLVDLGVLPQEFAARARVGGNTSLLGAAMIAVDATLERQLGGVGARLRHVQLALEEDFSGRYLAALRLEPWSLE